MLALHPEYVIDENDKKKAVIVSYIEWKKILENLEEFEDIRDYDLAKSIPDDVLSFDKALKEIENGKFDEL